MSNNPISAAKNRKLRGVEKKAAIFANGYKCSVLRTLLASVYMFSPINLEMKKTTIINVSPDEKV